MVLAAVFLALMGNWGYLPGAPEEPEHLSDSQVMLTLLDGEETVEISLLDYLTGAVAAEMPASFRPEALRAQAVALRSYVLYKLRHHTKKHGEDICSKSSCCAAWKGPAALREKWGEDYDTYIYKIRQAVWDTDGLYLSYEGQPAQAVFHASSAGMTESSETVWGSPVPYLVSVWSPETEENVRGFVQETEVTRAEFAEKFTSAHPEAVFPDGAPLAGELVYSDTGRLSSARVGGVVTDGIELRKLFSLRSAAVSIREEGDRVIFTTRGYGHGVGMSQYGANLMAAEGASWRDILAWYYPGTEVRALK